MKCHIFSPSLLLIYMIRAQCIPVIYRIKTPEKSQSHFIYFHPLNSAVKVHHWLGYLTIYPSYQSLLNPSLYIVKLT